MFSLWQNIKTGLSIPIDDMSIPSEERTRFLHFSIFSLIGIPLMIIFGLYNLMIGRHLLAALIIITALGLTFGYFYLRHSEQSKTVCRINITIFCMLILYMLFIGGEGGSKILWSFTFPMIAFFLFGKNEGLIWSTAFLLITAIVFFNPFEFDNAYKYSKAFQTRYIFSYFCVSAVSYWFEYFRHHYSTMLVKKNKALEQEIIERKLVQEENEELIIRLQEALKEVKTLSGFLPICSACKKIRDDKGYWNRIENYIRDHSDAEFSHSLCPDCTKELYSDFLGNRINKIIK